MLIQHTENKVARLENKFIFNAHYRLTANEQKIILFLASNIDPTESDFQKQTVPVIVLESNFDGGYLIGIVKVLRKCSDSSPRQQGC